MKTFIFIVALLNACVYVINYLDYIKYHKQENAFHALTSLTVTMGLIIIYSI